MTTLKREIAVIPGPAYVIAAIVFVFIQVCFHVFVWRHLGDAPHLAFQVLISLIPSTLLAVMVLMVGYVNRDAGRRGMSRSLWTTLVILIPNALGFILYFLLRNPIRTQCPQCGTIADVRGNFCPGCGYSLHPTCPQCKTAVGRADTFCANCGMSLGASK